MKPEEELADDCQFHVIPGLVLPPTLKRFALKGAQNCCGPAFAIPEPGVPEQGGAPPFTNTL